MSSSEWQGKGVLNEHTWTDPIKYSQRQAEKALIRRMNARVSRVIAQAWFDIGPNEKKIAEYLNANHRRAGEPEWTAARVNKRKGDERTLKFLREIERKADKLLFHNKEDLILSLLEMVHFDRRIFFNEVITWLDITDEDGKPSKIRTAQWVLKPMDEWPPGAEKIFEGIDWKIPKGQAPIPVLKLCDKMGAIEKLGKELGMFKDTKVLSNPDGSALGSHLASLSDEERVMAKDFAKFIAQRDVVDV